MARKSSKTDSPTAKLGFEAKLWLAADKLRNNMDAAEYKHVVLGLIFLKYISDSFDQHHAKLVKGKGDYEGANPEDPDEYRAENVFWVPKESRWSHLQAKAKQSAIGKIVDDAMVAIERDNPRLKGVLPKDYARPALDKHRLGELIDLIGTIALVPSNQPSPQPSPTGRGRNEADGEGNVRHRTTEPSPTGRGRSEAEGEGNVRHRTTDILGRVYEYFLTQFASAEGKNGGQFYTPSCVVRLLVEMLSPYKGRIYDPCCGSGGMFVQSEKFVEAHGGKLGDIAIYGQESNATTRRLAVMNLALRGIEADFGPEHADTFRRDLHPDLRADFVLANPPFNDSDWFRKDDDVRWQFGVPPKGPCLSERRNIIVVADEAHRSQYDLIDGLARHMRDALPQASFIGFTGTPIEKTDANTRAIFGDYISIYDIQRAVSDKATVPIYYESRIAKLGLNQAELPKIDEEFEQITEGEEISNKEKLKTKWAALEALVGDDKRLKLIAADLVAHFEKRWEALDGKAMVVCMSRRICVDLYKAITALRPAWAGAKEDDSEAEKGKNCIIKVVMTGSAEDGPEWQPHIRNKEKRRALANRFKDSKDPFRIVIVRDMWLTGFDAPCLHTMYADKPMVGHGLMQAIARVNRVFRDKPGGLVVDYLGLADQLKHALATYTESGGQGAPTYDTRKAIAVMMEKHGILCDMLHGFSWKKWTSGTPSERLSLIPAGQEHVLQLEDGKKRFVQVVMELSRAFALCAASNEATEIRDDVSFFQAIQAALNKQSVNGRKSPEQLNCAVRQLVSKAIVTDGQVIDVFTAAGLPKPDISILSDQFLAEVRGLKHKNVAAELLEKLLKDELKVRSRRNLVQSQVFSEKLKKSLNAYHNRAISTMEVLEELIALAKELDAATKRGVDMGLTDDEVAFYDALAANESAVKAMGDDKLKVIATELITKVRQSVTIDWTLRESARAKIRVMVKRILNKYGYPPDLQEEAVKIVLMQAELLCAEWA